MWKLGISKWIKRKKGGNCTNEHLTTELSGSLRSEHPQLSKGLGASRVKQFLPGCLLSFRQWAIAAHRRCDARGPSSVCRTLSDPSEHLPQIYRKVRESVSAVYQLRAGHHLKLKLRNLLKSLFKLIQMNLSSY